MSLHRPQTAVSYAPRSWQTHDDKMLLSYVRGRIPLDLMIQKLKRSEQSIRTRCVARKIPLDYLQPKKD